MLWRKSCYFNSKTKLYFVQKLVEKIENNFSDITSVLIFGAGNIGTSLSLQMYNLPLKVKLIDNRKNFISKINIPIEKNLHLNS